MKDLYTENYKAWLKEIKDPNKWKDTTCSWVERLHTGKMSILPTAIYRFNATTRRIPIAFFKAEVKKTRLSFIGNCKSPGITKTILKKEQQSGTIHNSWFWNLKLQ